MKKTNRLSHKERSLLAAQKEQERLEKLARLEEIKKRRQDLESFSNKKGKPTSDEISGDVQDEKPDEKIYCPLCREKAASRLRQKGRASTIFVIFGISGIVLTFTGIAIFLYTIFSSQFNRVETLLPLFNTGCLLFLIIAVSCNFLKKREKYYCSACGYAFIPGKIYPGKTKEPTEK